MTKKSILLGLGAIGALVLADAAGAQVLGGGVGGRVGAGAQVTVPTPAVPVDRATAAAGRATDRAAAAAKKAEAQAATTTRGQVSFPAGTVVRDSAGVQIGTVMAPDPSISSAGRVTIKTSTGFITVPASSLSTQGDVAISAQASADVGKPN